MQKKYGEFTVKLLGNESLITVYKNEELVKGISCAPANIDQKFTEVCKSVEKHVAKENTFVNKVVNKINNNSLDNNQTI